MKHAPSTAPKLYFFCLGYAGPRVLGSAERSSEAWDPQLRAALDEVAVGIRSRLPADRLLCLVGSLAQGADIAIAESLLAHGAALRAWLPEPIDRFANEADFPEPRDRERLAALTEHAQLAEVRVVSSASDRRERFAECAEAIVRDSDAMLFVRHWDAANGRGGTEETVALAAALGRPIVEVRLDPNPEARATVVFPATWAPLPDAGALPFPRPDPRQIVAEWKNAASAEARRSKGFIVRAAAWTVGLQLFATIFAVLTFDKPSWDVPSLLVKTAVILTAAGLALTAARRGVSARWAGRRFAAELQRSWWAVRGLPGAASWFEDDLPIEFVGHGRDLALFHGLDLGTTAEPSTAERAAGSPAASHGRTSHTREEIIEGEMNWIRQSARVRRTSGSGLLTQPHRLQAVPPHFRARYAKERIAGQRAYAEKSAHTADRGKRILQSLFYGCIAITLAALFTKLGLRATDSVDTREGLDKACSLVSILGPTLGGALISFVALFDLSARRETQKRLAEFLAGQDRELAACTDWASTRQVVVATEGRLLGEIKTWYARHAFSK